MGKILICKLSSKPCKFDRVINLIRTKNQNVLTRFACTTAVNDHGVGQRVEWRLLSRVTPFTNIDQWKWSTATTTTFSDCSSFQQSPESVDITQDCVAHGPRPGQYALFGPSGQFPRQRGVHAGQFQAGPATPFVAQSNL